jgi:hypothetical protein
MLRMAPTRCRYALPLIKEMPDTTSERASNDLSGRRLRHAGAEIVHQGSPRP